MKLELLGWTSKGLRCPDFRFDFRRRTANNEEPVISVALLQMPNGTGKTTTLSCLRAAMTGEARLWSPSYVKGFKGRTNNDSFGSFELKLRLDNRPLTFLMSFDFEEGVVQYATTYDRGRKEKFDPPLELYRYLEPHFVKLIVFDGELPQALLDPKDTRAEEAIEAFFQLYLLDEIADALQKVWEDRADQVTAKGQTGLTARRKRRDELREKVQGLEKALDEALSERERLQEEVRRLTERRDAHTGRTEGLREQQDALILEVAAADQAIQLGSHKLLARLREPHRVHHRVSTALAQLKAHLDRLKLPESTSRRFFEELLEEEDCICGRPLDDPARRRIRSKAEGYLGDEVVGVINALKSDITRMVEGVDAPGETLLDLAEDLASTVHGHDALATKLRQIAQNLVEKGDQELGAILDSLEQKTKRLDTVQGLIDELTRRPRPSDRKNDPHLLCLAFWKRALEKAEKDYAEVTETLTLRNNTETLRRILGRAKDTALARLSTGIIRDMNSTLARVLEGHHIQVKGIERSLLLQGQAGASQGQTLAVGYSFLATLFSRGQNQLPFIVDAPALALDTRVASEIGAKIPRICPQFIAFIIDRERAGFVPALEESAGSDNVLFLTAFSDRAENRQLLEKLPGEGVTRVSGGVVVEDRDFFDSAHFSEEESDG